VRGVMAKAVKERMDVDDGLRNVSYAWAPEEEGTRAYVEVEVQHFTHFVKCVYRLPFEDHEGDKPIYGYWLRTKGSSPEVGGSDLRAAVAFGESVKSKLGAQNLLG